MRYGQTHVTARREWLPFLARFRRIWTPTGGASSGRTLPSAGPRLLRCCTGACMVWDGKRKVRHARIGVGTDHWAVRREKLPPFSHFRRIRTAYHRCVQWPHPTKRGGTAPTVSHRGVYGLGRKKKVRHARVGVGTDHWAVRREKLPPFFHFRRIRTAYHRCVQWPHPTKRGGTAPYGSAGSMDSIV